MSWRALLEPDLTLGTTVLSLTPDLLAQHGLKGLILDVDETLLPTSKSQLSVELVQWATQLKLEANIWLVSNNLNEVRIQQIANSLGLPYLAGAGKPSRRKIRQALAAMALPPQQVGMVGDRLFTDVLAGNRLGLFTILVEPITDDGQTWKHWLRSLEIWLAQHLM
ncbi:MAG: YqeG family HAD IIIA-type phosphatase [Cyanobacteria bacterium]|nr:YqeG family HAD IIIA-type phosphatase [Cyanobacteriota bacterium]MDW8199686.1 YqeG family HAD IIIA-type phosphatase [Cyanobacteriota bacterium SKYGB_h_bin112]